MVKTRYGGEYGFNADAGAAAGNDGEHEDEVGNDGDEVGTDGDEVGTDGVDTGSEYDPHLDPNEGAINYLAHLPIETLPLGPPICFPDQFQNPDGEQLLLSLVDFLSHGGTVTDAIQPINFQQYTPFQLRTRYSTYVAYNTATRPLLFFHHWSYHPTKRMIDLSQYDEGHGRVTVNSKTWIEGSDVTDVGTDGARTHYRLLYSVNTNSPFGNRIDTDYGPEHLDVYSLNSQLYEQVMQDHNPDEQDHESKFSRWNVVALYRGAAGGLLHK